MPLPAQLPRRTTACKRCHWSFPHWSLMAAAARCCCWWWWPTVQTKVLAQLSQRCNQSLHGSTGRAAFAGRGTIGFCSAPPAHFLRPLLSSGARSGDGLERTDRLTRRRLSCSQARCALHSCAPAPAQPPSPAIPRPRPGCSPIAGRRRAGPGRPACSTGALSTACCAPSGTQTTACGGPQTTSGAARRPSRRDLQGARQSHAATGPACRAATHLAHPTCSCAPPLTGLLRHLALSPWWREELLHAPQARRRTEGPQPHVRDATREPRRGRAGALRHPERQSHGDARQPWRWWRARGVESVHVVTANHWRSARANTSPKQATHATQQ